MPKASTHQEVGKAYAAWLAYNKHARGNRISSFDLSRWLNVVHSLNGKATIGTKGLKGTGTWERSVARRSIPSKKWTKEHHAKFKRTIEARKFKAMLTP